MRKCNWLYVGCALVTLSTLAVEAAQGPPSIAASLERARQARTAPATIAEGEVPRLVVDCDDPDGLTINRVLSKAAELGSPVEIELHGMCNEHVVVEIDDVAFIGADPSLDGIVGPTGAEDPLALVQVFDAENIRFENVGIAGSETTGLGAWYAGLEMVGSRVSGNAATGVHISSSSFAELTDTEISDNARGIRGQRNGYAICYGCSIHGNAAYGVAAGFNGLLWAEDSTIEAAPDGLAVQTEDFGETVLIRGEITGNVYTWGYTWLQGVTQTSDPAVFNAVLDDGLLQTVSDDLLPTTLTGLVHFESFSHAVFNDGTVLGDLLCSEGSDAVCRGSVTVGSSNCELCPVP